MGGIQDILRIFVIGVVSIGMITALVSSGRQTTGVITAAGNASSKLLSTAVKG